MTIPAPVMAYVIDPLERAGRTFLQQLFVVLMAAGSAGLLVTQNWLVAVDSAGFAAAVSLLMSLATFKVPPLSPVVDVLLRVVKTFGQSFVGTLAASHVLTVSGADWKGALAVAIPVALSALLTSLVALGVPGTSGASFVPAGVTSAVDDGSAPEVDVQAVNGKALPVRLDSLQVSDPPVGPKHAA